MSSRTRSKGPFRRASKPSRPFSAKVTVCPSCSRARPSKSRFTRLSSTTRSRPDCVSAGEAMSKRSEVAGDKLVLGGEPLDPVAGLLQSAGPSHGLELPREGGHLDSTQALAGGLERVRRAAEGITICLGQGLPDGRDEPTGVVQEGVDQLGDEGTVHGGGEPIECRP